MDRESRISALQADLLSMVADHLTPVALRYGYSDVPLETNIKWRPQVLVIGNYSSGKSTLINEFLGAKIQATGQAPTDDSFTIITYDDSTPKNSPVHITEERDGNYLLNDSEWGTLMAKHHYLGFKSLVGKSIRYAAIAEWAQHRTQNQLKRLWSRYDDKKRCYIPPSEPTIRRVLQSINAETVDQAIYGWLSSLFSGSAVAFDGKVLKGARYHEGKQVHLLSAIIQQKGITIAQKQIASKTNEIPTACPLLEPLYLKGQVVTGDALHTQQNLARFLVEEKQADYLFTVKDNQPTLKDDIKALALNEGFPPQSGNY